MVRPLQLSNMTHLSLGIPHSRGRKRGKRDKNVALSNDSASPWLSRPSNLEVYRAVETIAPSVLMTSSATVPVYGSAQFVLANVGNSSSYTDLFDQYRIVLIEALIEPVISETITPSGDTGEWVSVVDIDDATQPNNYNDLTNYTTAVQTRGYSSHYHRWVPTIALAAYSGTFTSYASAENQWLDAASPNVAHYAIKAGTGVAIVPQAYILTCRFHLEFRTRH